MEGIKRMKKLTLKRKPKIKPEYSLEHKKFLKKRRLNIALVWILRIGLLALLLGFWELSTALGWVDSFIVSSPSRVCKTIGSLYSDGTLFYHIGVTLLETLIGFVIAVVLGVLVALALWWSDTVRRVLEPYIVVLNALPKIALGPLIIICSVRAIKQSSL